MGNNSRDLSNSNTLQTSNSSSSSLGKDRASSDRSKDSRSNLAPRKQTSENDPELLLLNNSSSSLLSSSNFLLNRISFLSWSRPLLANRTSMRSSLTRTDSAFSLLPNNNNSNSFSHNNSLASFSSSNSSNLNNSFSSNSSFKHFLNPSSNLVTA